MEIKKTNVSVLLVMLCVGFILTGCEAMRRGNIGKMYPGEKLPIDQIAILESPGTAIRVVSINGEKIGAYPFKNVFELLPGDYKLMLNLASYLDHSGNREVVVQSLNTLTTEFRAKPDYWYWVRAFLYLSNDIEIYAPTFYKLAAETANEKAMACKEKLSIKWKPEVSDWKWYPYILEYGQMYYVSQRVVDWKYKGVATLLPEERADYFNALSSTIEKQQNLAKECMGDEAEAYFKGVQIYEFPLKYW